MAITGFFGPYRFLSNFHECPITVFGLTFQNSEAAYQSQKCPDRAVEFINLSPGLAKRLGRKVEMRPDWDAVKDNIMWETLQAKFDQNEGLKVDLLLTGDSYLEEGNDWGDTYWGTVGGVGENHLGVMLMHLRDIYQEDQLKVKPLGQHNFEMRQRSGHVDSQDPLVSFFYILLRDHLPAGVVEGILREHVLIEDKDAQFCNGWVADYAKDIVKRLRDYH
jgi:ribA/ribD-fused uncharacterized protein